MTQITGFKAFSTKANAPLANTHATETSKPDQTPPTSPPADKPSSNETKPK